MTVLGKGEVCYWCYIVRTTIRGVRGEWKSASLVCRPCSVLISCQRPLKQPHS